LSCVGSDLAAGLITCSKRATNIYQIHSYGLLLVRNRPESLIRRLEENGKVSYKINN
jgi:hypothetical protein